MKPMRYTDAQNFATKKKTAKICAVRTCAKFSFFSRSLQKGWVTSHRTQAATQQSELKVLNEPSWDMHWSYGDDSGYVRMVSIMLC